MLDDNATRARAIIESTWDQDVNGDSQCNNQGVSWGLLQVKDRLPRGCAAGPHESAYPDVFISTANNLNYALAWVVACYRGDMSEWIPNDFMADSALRMRHCTGLWFSGTWRRGNSGYLANYDTALANKPWLGASFPSWNVSGVCRTIDCDTLPASQDQVPDDTTPPSIPADLTADVVSTSRIDLSWRASMDDVGVTGYRLERCQGASCTDFAEIAQPSGTSFSNTGLVAGTAYRYRVHAADAAGNLSEYSDIVSATTNNGGAVTAGLVAHWQFDANADDGVGANHGTLLNGA